MKITMKTIKRFLSTALTLLTLVVLFAVIFIRGGWVNPDQTFFKELIVTISLALTMKLWWYDYAEDKRLNEDDLVKAKEHYYSIVDATIKDSNDLDKYLVILNKENREHYIKNKIGSRNPSNLAKKTKWMCFWHPSYRKMTAEEIGELRYAKLYFKYTRKADKLRQVKSAEIMALTSVELLYDSKNYSKQHKRTYQIITTILSMLLTTLFASMALEQIMLNWINVFRYLSYVCSIVITIAMTVVKAYKQTGDDMYDYLNRLKFIIDKYATYKEKEGNNEHVGT